MTQLTRKEALDLSALVGLTPRELKSLRPDALARFDLPATARAEDMPLAAWLELARLH